LSPGEYILHIKAANNNGIWNPTATQLFIIIHPPFWQTWWFRVLLLLLVIAGGVLLYKWRVRLIQQQHGAELKRSEEQRTLQSQLNQELKEKLDFQQKLEIAQQQQIETERKTILLEREKLLGRYQNLVNQLNPHFLFNSLAVLDSLIYKDHKMASKYLRQLTKVYRYLIENDHQEVVKLEQEMHFAQDFIGLLQMRYGEGLSIEMVIPAELYDKKIVPVTIQNLIENAIKHNTTAVESPLQISIREENGYLVVENNLQKRGTVTTSNKRGLNDFKALYSYLSSKPVEVAETDEYFRVSVPLLG
jgi:LytS/YehU family sensor histidine kinase